MKIIYHTGIEIAENIHVYTLNNFAELFMDRLFSCVSWYIHIIHDYFLVVNRIYMIFFMLQNERRFYVDASR